jgi:glycosyltransferase involved in cell wall biosynthesis
MTNVRVLHIAPHLEQGGAERLLYSLATSEVQGVHHQVVLMQDKSFFDRERLNTISLGFNLANRGQAARHLVPAVRRLRKVVAEQRPDIIQGWLYYGALMTVLIGRTQAPVVWSIHNTTLPKFSAKPLLAMVDRQLAVASRSKPARIAYCAETARQVHEANGYDPKPGTVIDNGIDMSVFRPNSMRRLGIRQQLGLSADAFVVGLFGRFDPQKDVLGCLEAFALARKKHPELMLLLAGRDMDAHNRELNHWIAERKLWPACKVLGPRTDIQHLLNATDAVMLGSRYGEAMPLILLEALASRVPVATTAVGDVGRLGVPQRAIVPAASPAKLAEAISFVRQTAGSAQWDIAFETVRRRFSIERYVASHVSLYAGLLDRHTTVGEVS